LAVFRSAFSIDNFSILPEITIEKKEKFPVQRYKKEAKKRMRNTITINPQICHGKPCIANHRIPVYMVLELIAEGISFDEIIEQYYPTLTKEEITDCVLYAQHLLEPEPIEELEPAEMAV
jgi:uncharacterized protein (DUF433 family)